jgi:steroid delta-isomerase-like uncharacterized protein
MSEEENKAAARSFFEEVWNKANVAQADAFLAPGFVSHNSMGFTIKTVDDYRGGVLRYRAAFPDLVTTVEDMIAEGDRVVVRGTDRGTQLGEFMGQPATGKMVTSTWIEIFRMESGRAVEGWVETDTRVLLGQLTPETPSAGQE